MLIEKCQLLLDDFSPCPRDAAWTGHTDFGIVLLCDDCAIDFSGYDDDDDAEDWIPA